MFIIYAGSVELCLAENDLELKIFLPSLPKCQDYRQELYKIKVCVCVRTPAIVSRRAGDATIVFINIVCWVCLQS